MGDKSLCFRCEWRAAFLEDGHRPRHECGETDRAVWCCYMYVPTKPFILVKANKKDKRPFLGPPLFSARRKRVRTPELMLDGKKYRDGHLVYWVPLTLEEKRARAKRDREIKKRLDRWQKELLGGDK